MIEKSHPGTYVTVVCGQHLAFFENYSRTTFAKNLKKDVLFCEYTHPDISELTRKQALRRVYEYKLDRVAAQIVGVNPLHEHKKFIGLELTVKAAGPMGPEFERMVKKGLVKFAARGTKTASGDWNDLITFDIVNAE